LLTCRERQPQPFFDQRAHRLAVAPGDRPRACEQVVAKLDRRFHMGAPYRRYGS